MTLQSLLDLVVTTLRGDLRCESIADVETQAFSEEKFFVKVRAQVRGELFLQVRIYYNQGHYDYSYQLFKDRPLSRWDNKEDCPGLENFPHHRHLPDATIVASSLRGDPVVDLPIVVQEIRESIPAKLSTPVMPASVQPTVRARRRTRR
jgi:Family of unknown function (DUF6516)